MTALSKMQVEIKEQGIVFTRMFDAPRRVVWDAWTKKEHLLSWWGPHGFTNKDCSLDLRVGGKFLITMVGPDGSSYPCVFILDEIVPIEKMVWTDVVDPRAEFWGDAGPPPSSKLTLLFEDLGSKTKMTMISAFDSNADRDKILGMGAAEGWAESLERLDALLATR